MLRTRLFSLLLVFWTATAALAYAPGDYVIYKNPNYSNGEICVVKRVDSDGVWLEYLGPSKGKAGIVCSPSQLHWLTPANADGTPIAANPTAPAGATAPPPAGRIDTAAAPVPPSGDLSWLYGTWSIFIPGATLKSAPGDGYVYTQQEIAARGGLLAIRPNGTYTWQVRPGDPSSKHIQGRWRPAKETENAVGGPAIRILDGEFGWDFTVTQRKVDQPGVHVYIYERGYSYNGRRVRVR